MKKPSFDNPCHPRLVCSSESPPPHAEGTPVKVVLESVALHDITIPPLKAFQDSNDVTLPGKVFLLRNVVNDESKLFLVSSVFLIGDHWTAADHIDRIKDYEPESTSVLDVLGDYPLKLKMRLRKLGPTKTPKRVIYQIAHSLGQEFNDELLNKFKQPGGGPPPIFRHILPHRCPGLLRCTTPGHYLLFTEV